MTFSHCFLRFFLPQAQIQDLFLFPAKVLRRILSLRIRFSLLRTLPILPLRQRPPRHPVLPSRQRPSRHPNLPFLQRPPRRPILPSRHRPSRHPNLPVLQRPPRHPILPVHQRPPRRPTLPLPIPLPAQTRYQLPALRMPSYLFLQLLLSLTAHLLFHFRPLNRHSLPYVTRLQFLQILAPSAPLTYADIPADRSRYILHTECTAFD